MEKSRDVILEKAFESALNYERKYTGCGQTTICVFDFVYGIRGAFFAGSIRGLFRPVDRTDFRFRCDESRTQ